jgi:hypothetical protein
MSARSFGWVVAAGLSLAACLGSDGVPGNERVELDFTAEPLELGCALKEVPTGNLQFRAIFSRVRDGQGAWLTLNRIARPAEFDGQVVRSQMAAARRFEACECAERTDVVETMTFALLSPAQAQALGGACPEDALDGGVPTDADAGLLPPGALPDGLDAERACGVMVDRVVPGEGCLCEGCELRYRLTGTGVNR